MSSVGDHNGTHFRFFFLLILIVFYMCSAAAVAAATAAAAAHKLCPGRLNHLCPKKYFDSAPQKNC